MRKFAHPRRAYSTSKKKKGRQAWRMSEWSLAIRLVFKKPDQANNSEHLRNLFVHVREQQRTSPYRDVRVFAMFAILTSPSILAPPRWRPCCRQSGSRLLS